MKNKGNIKNSVLIVVLVLLAGLSIGAGVQLARPKPTPEVYPPIRGGDFPRPIVREEIQPPTEEIKQLLEATNKARQAEGLPSLVLDKSLTTSAMAKCLDMQARNYWAHESTPGELTEHFRRHLPGVVLSGENLALNTGSPQETVDAWMDSPSHRENVLAKYYDTIGFAICEGPVGRVTVQHFAYIP